MHAEIIIDEIGHITLPQSMREELYFVPGDTLVFDIADKAITLCPVRETPCIVYKQGISVLYVGADFSPTIVKDILEQMRLEREHSFLYPGE